jgi:peptidoglycan/LPS O-acetylase OafA/YrhL
MTRTRPRFRGLTFADVTSGRENNLNLLRMIAATSVVFSHSYALTGHMLEEPLAFASGQRTDAATIGVVMFFAISGFLIAQSLARRRSLYAYAVARALRIVPGLLFAKLLCVFVVGWYATSLATSAYFGQKMTWMFLAASPFLDVRDHLPGVFATNPYPNAVNGSLWTIPIETWCYVVAGLLAIAGVLARAWLLTAFAACAIVAFALFPATMQSLLPALGIGTIPGLVFTFFLASWLHACRQWIPLSASVAIAGVLLLVLFADTRFFRPAYYVVIAYATLVVAYHPRLLLRAYLRVGDYSYGTYLLAFPVQQFIAWRFGIRDPLVLFGSAMLATLPLASLSWHIVEKPLLAMKEYVASWRPWPGYAFRNTTRS